jgi:hypothetical protein
MSVAARDAPPPEAFSRLSAGLHVGLDYFERRHLSQEGADPPRGLVDSLDELSRPDAPAARVHPAIRAFFERTAELELLVLPSYHRGFGALAWVAHTLARLIGQLVYPVRRSRIDTRIVALDAAQDGRPGARGVVRSYADRGRVMQVAAYASLREGAQGTMSVAFPLLAGRLTGLLQLELLDEESEGFRAAALSSRPRAGHVDGLGVWLDFLGLRLRLPFEESLRFWAPSMHDLPVPFDPEALPGATIFALHEQRILGLRVVAHRYHFRPRADQPRGSSTAVAGLPA